VHLRGLPFSEGTPGVEGTSNKTMMPSASAVSSMLPWSNKFNLRRLSSDAFGCTPSTHTVS
jgi:hypothetical protein